MIHMDVPENNMIVITSRAHDAIIVRTIGAPQIMMTIYNTNDVSMCSLFLRGATNILVTGIRITSI
jgi:putative protein kinase ArgK-like GTPase of G3E family